MILLITRDRYSSGNRWSLILSQYIFHLFRLFFPLDVHSYALSVVFFLPIASSCNAYCLHLRVERPQRGCSFIHPFDEPSFIHSFNTFVPRGDTGLLSQRLGTSLTVLYNMISLDMYLDFLSTPAKDEKA